MMEIIKILFCISARERFLKNNEKCFNEGSASQVTKQKCDAKHDLRFWNVYNSLLKEVIALKSNSTLAQTGSANSPRLFYPRGGVLSYMGYIGMCGTKGYGFTSAVLVINKVSIFAL